MTKNIDHDDSDLLRKDTQSFYPLMETFRSWYNTEV